MIGTAQRITGINRGTACLQRMGKGATAIILQRAETRINAGNVTESTTRDSTTGYVFDQVITLASHGSITIIL